MNLRIDKGCDKGCDEGSWRELLPGRGFSTCVRSSYYNYSRLHAPASGTAMFPDCWFIRDSKGISTGIEGGCARKRLEQP